MDCPFQSPDLIITEAAMIILTENKRPTFIEKLVAKGKMARAAKEGHSN